MPKCQTKTCPYVCVQSVNNCADRIEDSSRELQARASRRARILDFKQSCYVGNKAKCAQKKTGFVFAQGRDLQDNADTRVPLPSTIQCVEDSKQLQSCHSSEAPAATWWKCRDLDPMMSIVLPSRGQPTGPGILCRSYKILLLANLQMNNPAAPASKLPSNSIQYCLSSDVIACKVTVSSNRKSVASVTTRRVSVLLVRSPAAHQSNLHNSNKSGNALIA